MLLCGLIFKREYFTQNHTAYISQELTKRQKLIFKTPLVRKEVERDLTILLSFPFLLNKQENGQKIVCRREKERILVNKLTISSSVIGSLYIFKHHINPGLII